MVEPTDLIGAILILGAFGGLIAVAAGFSPSTSNPFDDTPMYTVEPVVCVQQSPLLFEISSLSVDAERQERPTFSAVATPQFSLLGAQDAKIAVQLSGTTVNGKQYTTPTLDKVFDVDDLDFLLGKDNCFKDTAISEGIGTWKNVPAGDYTLTATLTDDGETKDTDEITTVLPE